MRNSTAAHTGWLLLLLLAITATTIWLFAGAQWDQSSIFRPTVQFLSLFDNFWRCTVGPKFNFPSHCAIFVSFCHFLPFFDNFLVIFGGFLSIFGDFWQFLVIFVNFWRFLTIFDNFWWLIIHIMRGACCWPNLGLVKNLLVNLGEHWCTIFPT